ncbi:ABC transporter substrate-binding protein [Phytoactinopolyspora endophytica]|uniref:ABC transporter substrate-binding protein n=1 Tax=Phytoactinopolyspora endophytica TaxID=1642495 RepID=UPI003B837226
MPMSTYRHRTVATIALAGALTLFLASCGSDDDSGSGDSDVDLEATLDEGGSLTVWAWEPTLDQVVDDFEAEYPEVEVDLVNAGTGDEHYTALNNAISAGSGVPDAAQIEYFALPEYALQEYVTDLTEFGAEELEGTFTPGPWGSVHQGDAIYGLPMDSGPMAMFYNQEVFDTYDVEVPATWDEYIDAARALQEADPNVYIGSDAGDAGFTTSILWQAGAHPYQVDGTDVTIDFTGEETTRFAETWQQLIDEDLVSDIPGWTDEWYQGLADGTIATLNTGAWMPANLESGVSAASGDWRVAPLPQWEEGGTASAENGGSSLAVPEASENKALAYAFIEYANAGDGVQTRLDQGAFPATSAHLESEEFLSREFEYFGGQQANEIFAESAANVVEGWTYLPFQVYANSIFNDTVGQAYISGTTLNEGLLAWQDASITYGEDQGFTMNQ